MKRHRLFTAIVVSGLAVAKCGGRIDPPDAGSDANTNTTKDASDDADAAILFADATLVDDAESDAALDAFVKPPVITH